MAVSKSTTYEVLTVKEYTIDEWKIVDVVMFVLITTNVLGHKECTEELVLKCKTGKWRFLEECEGCITKTGDHIFLYFRVVP